jgi:hypothetical protein
VATRIYSKAAATARARISELLEAVFVDSGIAPDSLLNMSDGIIDLTQYLNRWDEDEEEEGGTFALWGADGERSRFALPLWRAIYLADAERGCIAWSETGSDLPKPFVVLDLARDPARLEMARGVLKAAEDGVPPVLRDRGGEGLDIYLGERDNRVWHLVVDGGRKNTGALEAKAREDILFLAGECAGLLFLRDFADEVE